MKSLGFQGALQQPTQKWTRTKLGDVCTVEYELPYSQWRQWVPKIYSKHPENSHIWLTHVEVEQTGGPRCKVTLSYEPGDNPANNDELQMPGDANGREFSEQGASLELPIQEHPDFDDNEKFPGKIWEGKQFMGFENLKENEHNKFGVTHFIPGTMTVTVTTYSRNEPAEVKDLIGKLVDPPGYHSYTGKKNFLIITASNNSPRTRVHGAFWGTVAVYQFNKAGWDKDIYPEG